MDVGRRFYDDGNYWSNIGVNTNVQQKIGTFFQNTIRIYGLVWKDFSRKYVDNILMHSFIPERYSDRFFDFVNRFYMVALSGQMLEDLDAKLQKFAEVFSSKDFTEVYQEFKSFNPIVSTKSILTNSEYFGPLVTKMIRRLANDYEKIDEVNLGVYEGPFRIWYSSLGTDKSKRMFLNEAPYLQYDIVRSKFKIIIPPQRVATNDNRVVIRNSKGGELITSPLYVSKQFDSYISSPIDLDYKWNPLEEFFIYIGQNKIYNNGNPGHLILNKHGKRRNKLSLGTNMLVIPNGVNINLMHENLATYVEYKVVTFIIIEGQRLEVMGSTYSVEREVSDTIHITTPSVGVECRDQDGNRYDVYRTLPKIKITSDLESSRFQFAVIHGLDRIVYQDFDMLSRDAACERVDSSVVLDLEASTMAKSDGIYTLRSHNRDIHRFVVLQNFYYQFAEVEYKENGKSTMRCSYIDEDVEFDTDRGDVALPAIKMDGRDLTITIQIPSRRFSFDKIHWKMFDSDEIYFQNFAHKNIYIYCPTLIIPVITANIKDSKPLNLDIDGRYLVADIGRIKQISCLLQYSSVYMPKIRFCCDKYDLFTIRYYASYERDGNIITRVDAPESTYGRLIVPDRDPIIFQDWVEIPDVYDCIIQIEECYDDGFSGELSIKVKKIDRGFYLACDPNLIIHGSSINDFKYVCDGDEHYYRGNPFYHIYGIDGPAPDKNALEIERKAFNKMDEMAYPRLEDKVKEYILNDRDGKRTAARMMRLKDIDREFAIRLGENYQKKNTSVWVTEELSSLKC